MRMLTRLRSVIEEFTMVDKLGVTSQSLYQSSDAAAAITCEGHPLASCTIPPMVEAVSFLSHETKQTQAAALQLCASIVAILTLCTTSKFNHISSSRSPPRCTSPDLYIEYYRSSSKRNNSLYNLAFFCADSPFSPRQLPLALFFRSGASARFRFCATTVACATPW